MTVLGALSGGGYQVIFLIWTIQINDPNLLELPGRERALSDFSSEPFRCRLTAVYSI